MLAIRRPGWIEGSGARGLDRSLGVLLDGVAMRGSLRSCPESLRLEDVLDTNGLVETNGLVAVAILGANPATFVSHRELPTTTKLSLAKPRPI